MNKVYDLIIIGAGPAGLTAAIYAQRARLNTVVLEKLTPGGQIILSEKIENYPGFPEVISAQKLMKQVQKQAENLGTKLKHEEARSIALEDEEKIIHTSGGKKYKTLAVIIATGAETRRLGIEREKEFIGRGISYCATCDAPFFRNQQVAVVGGGNMALQEALYLSKFAEKIYLVHRREMLRGEKILQERITKNPKIEIIWRSVVDQIYGEEKVKGVKLKNLKTKKTHNLPCSGLFIFVGLKPNTEFVQNILELDEKGFIKTGENLESSRRGIFVCGDVRKNLLKQVIVACGEGALATHMAEKYINEVKGIEYK
ncbi:thioredoxin-disulfide reductase [Candidatus Aerophobetes bacterium]|uniref:Thioredoxin reductase n=1 Tax=Aerophobetes bacterium TaxID=2030807 RepID=A0A523S466_UNCAE|nr:MAG: thioredoxin-disulfide reductase [Candidatus Aerophobetes bacterium]